MLDEVEEDRSSSSHHLRRAHTRHCTQHLNISPPLDREIIRLIHWEGFSQEDAARIVGKPAGTVRSRYSRARATLRTQLDPVSNIGTDHRLSEQ